MPAMSMVQALNSGMDVMLARNPDVVVFGEDVGFYGGVFRVTEGLQKKHGDHRVFDAPIAEFSACTILIPGMAQTPSSCRWRRKCHGISLNTSSNIVRTLKCGPVCIVP